MLKFQIPVPRVYPAELAEEVLAAFADAAGPVAVEGIRAVLGTAQMDLSLSEPYRDRKIAGKILGMKRIAGKDDDQPGILTGSLYEGVNHQPEPGIGFSVGIEESAGVSEDGDDYAQTIEERTEYLEKGVRSVEPVMKQALERVIGRVMAEAGG